MSQEERIRRLEEELLNARQERQAEQRLREEEQRLREEEKRLREEEQRLREEAERKLENTTFLPYIMYRHQLMVSRLSVETNLASLSKGEITKIKGKSYPKTLCKWDAFSGLHKEHFAGFCETFAGAKCFSSFAATVGVSQTINLTPVASERALDSYERQFETGIKEIFNEYLSRTESPGTRITFQADANSLPNKVVDRKPIAAITSEPSTGSSPRQTTASSSSRDHQSSPAQALLPSVTFVVNTEPDAWCIRIRDTTLTTLGKPTRPIRSPIFILDHKALHKVPAEAVFELLGGDSPTISLADMARAKNKRQKQAIPAAQATSSDSDNITTNILRRNLAASLTQLFHYMVTFGLMYGYVSTGETLILLHFQPDTPTSLFYHLAQPKRDVALPPLPDSLLECQRIAKECSNNLAQTAIAKVLTLSALAFKEDQQQNIWRSTVLPHLKIWPEAYEGAPAPVSRAPSKKRQKDDDDSEDDSGGGDGDNRHPLRLPSELSRGVDDGAALPTQSVTGQQRGDSGRPMTQHQNRREQLHPTSEKAVRIITPARPPHSLFCTLKCLRGLQKSNPLDYSCPNIEYHLGKQRGGQRQVATPGGGGRQVMRYHPLSAPEFCQRVRQQLAANMFDDFIDLDQIGLYGAVGALFKLTLHEHGYTLVAKGVQYADYEALDWEARVYAALDDLQGARVPVCLGLIDLVEEYRLAGGARIIRMLLMSFAGHNLTEIKPGAVRRGAELEVIDVDVDAETNEIVDQLAKRGVDHGDIREANVVWNEELGRLMFVDFDQAEMFTPTPDNGFGDDVNDIGGIDDVNDINDINGIHDIHDSNDTEAPHKRRSTYSADEVESKRVKTHQLPLPPGADSVCG